MAHIKGGRSEDAGLYEAMQNAAINDCRDGPSCGKDYIPDYNWRKRTVENAVGETSLRLWSGLLEFRQFGVW